MKSVFCASYYGSNYDTMAALTLHENRMEFVKRWNFPYLFTRFDDGAPNEPWKVTMRRMSFRKFEVILMAMHLTDAEWIWYADCDGMIMNMAFDLMDWIGLHTATDGWVFNTVDSNGPNGGSMLIHNSPRSRAFLEAALELKNNSAIPYDNEAMMEVSKDFPGAYKLLHQRPLNTYDYSLYPGQGKAPNDFLDKSGQFQAGDFFLHWPGRTLEQRIAHYHEMKGKVIR